MISNIRLFLINFLISTILLKNCGIINIFQNEKKINSITPYKTQKSFQSEKNGKSLTISGWIFLEDKKNRNNQIIKINLKQELNSKLAKELIRIEYNKIFNNNSELILRLTENNNSKKVIKEKIEFPLENWIFLTLSFNFEKNKFNLLIEGLDPSKFIFAKNYEILFSEFEILKIIDFNFGCYDNKVDECFIGGIKNFNLFLNFSDDLETLKFLDFDNENRNFLFDINENSKKQDFLSKDLKPTSYEIKGKKIYGDNEENHIIFKGGNVIEIKDIILFDFLKINESPTLYFVFKYKEPLPDKFPIFFQKDFSKNNQIEIFLKKNGNKKRSIIVNFFNKIIFESENYLEENKMQNFSISFLRSRTSLKILFTNKIKNQISEKILFPAIENGKIELLNTDIKYVGKFYLYQFNILKNSSGIILSNILKKENDKECKNNCLIFSSFFETEKKCIECNSDKVLFLERKNCEFFCPKNFKNINNRCFKCKEENCSEIDQDFFEIQKSGENQIILKTKKDLKNFKNDFSKSFDVSIKNGVKSEDFDFDVEDDKKNNRGIYDFKFFNDKLDNKKIIFSPKKNIFIYDSKKNLFQNPIFLKSDSLAGSKAVLIPEKKKLESKKKNKKNSKNHNLKYLAIISSIIFYLTMIIGLIGVIFKCPYISSDWNTFYEQKFLQAFLICQYLVFWTLYNFSPPENLNSFFFKFFEIIIKWHKIFKETTQSDNLSSKYFNDYFFVNKKERFFENDIYTHFFTNFSFIILLQFIFLFFYLVSKIIYYFLNKQKLQINYQPENPEIEKKNQSKMKIINFFRIINDFFEWQFIITIFLMFIIECSIFIFYNFYHKNFSHAFFIFSLILAIIYLMIILFFLSILFLVPVKYSQTQNKRNLSFWFVWKGLVRNKFQKFFQAIQYLFYFIFSIVIVFSYNNKNIQIIVNFIFLILFFVYIVVYRPANEKFWKYEQIGIHAFMILTKLLLLILIVDDDKNNISENNKSNIGYTIAVFIFLILLWNFVVLLVKLIMRLIACYNAKQITNNNNSKLIINKEEENNLVDGKENNLVNENREENYNIFDFDKNEEFPKMGGNPHFADIVKPDKGEEDFYDDVLKQKKIDENVHFEDQRDNLINSEFDDREKNMTRDNKFIEKVYMKEKDEFGNFKIYDDDKNLFDNDFDKKRKEFENDKLRVLAIKERTNHLNHNGGFDSTKNIGYNETISFGKSDNRFINTLLKKNKNISGRK